MTKVMTKNIEDLLYRGDSLERMGEMSGRLREDSRKYKKAAVRINWELLLKQVGSSQILPFLPRHVRANDSLVWSYWWCRSGYNHFDMVEIFLKEFDTLVDAQFLVWLADYTAPDINLVCQNAIIKYYLSSIKNVAMSLDLCTPKW